MKTPKEQRLDLLILAICYLLRVIYDEIFCEFWI